MRIAFLVPIAATALLAACTQTAQQPTPRTDEDKTLYAMGALLAENVKSFELTDQELVMLKAGLTDGAKDQSKMDREALEASITGIQKLGTERAAAAREREKKAGEEYLAKAAAEEGAQKLDSGMIYKPVKEGSGDSPVAADTVSVHYEGHLISGKVFDSSRKHGDAPVSFPLNGVIPCWTEGVQKMKVGGTAQLTCPPDLAYGDMGSPPDVPGGSTLVFDVELLGVEKTPAEPPAAK